jgi:hypothetical protein
MHYCASHPLIIAVSYTLQCPRMMVLRINRQHDNVHHHITFSRRDESHGIPMAQQWIQNRDMGKGTQKKKH